MTNEDLKKVIADLGDRLCVIFMDNNHRLIFGYKKGKDCWSHESIQFKTWGGVDFFGCSQNSGLTEDNKNGVSYTVWHRTDCIQAIGSMDEGFGDYRIDPFIW